MDRMQRKIELVGCWWFTVKWFIAGCLVVALIGCGPPMSRGEQLAFGAMIGGQMADYESTRKYISIGGTEMNPALGARPDNDSIALLKIGTVLTLWGLGEIWPEHRVPIYSLGAVSGFAAYAWNDRLYEKYKGY